MILQELIQQLLTLFSCLLILVFNPLVFIPALIIIIVLIKKNKEYKNGAYYQITKLPYYSMRHDKGRYGEYLIYKYLKSFETNGAKFLFNVYVPKENGETTEIDVLMICSKGVFVFESKNYSGWIFGNESSKNWYQTLPTGRGQSHKEHFYNPVMQNRSHIKYLNAFLGEQVPVRSIITFSDRCTLKSIQIRSNDVSVINRYNVYPVVSAICNQLPDDLMSDNDIINLYNKLYPYTQVDEFAKLKHIENIHNKLNSQADEQTSSGFSSTLHNETFDIEPGGGEASVSSINNKAETQLGVVTAEVKEKESNEQKMADPQDLKCPKCNGNLVLRIATRGVNSGNQFYGCSNYPKCKYVQNIKRK